MFNAPTIADFKARFYRDFPYGTDMNVAVLDQDILIAFNSCDNTINQGLYVNQSNYSENYLLLSAHFLVLNLRSSSQGLNGQYNWTQNSKSVQGVSEAFSIPQQVLDNPNYMAYTKTNYGAMFLNNLWPQLAGQMFTVFGRTNP